MNFDEPVFQFKRSPAGGLQSTDAAAGLLYLCGIVKYKVKSRRIVPKAVIDDDSEYEDDDVSVRGLKPRVMPDLLVPQWLMQHSRLSHFEPWMKKTILEFAVINNGDSIYGLSSYMNGQYIPPNLQLLDRSPNIGPLISAWELEKFENCWNKRFWTSKILKLLYQLFSSLLICQRDIRGQRLGAMSNNRWLGCNICLSDTILSRNSM